MAKKKKQLSPKYQVWVDARKRFHLSNAHTQMARDLGMNPKRFGGKAVALVEEMITKKNVRVIENTISGCVVSFN